MGERGFCHYCGPGYRYGDEGCRHKPPQLHEDELADVRAWNDLTARAERAEDAIQRVRALAERYKAEWLDNNGGQFFEDCYSDLLAALDPTECDDPECFAHDHPATPNVILAAGYPADSTDPVEDAPKKRMCPDARREPGGCPTEWRYTEGGAWHQCEDIRSGPHPRHVCGCGTTVESPLFGGQLDAPAPTRSSETSVLDEAEEESPESPRRPGRPVTIVVRRSDAGLPADGEERK